MCFEIHIILHNRTRPHKDTDTYFVKIANIQNMVQVMTKDRKKSNRNRDKTTKDRKNSNRKSDKTTKDRKNSNRKSDKTTKDRKKSNRKNRRNTLSFSFLLVAILIRLCVTVFAAEMFPPISCENPRCLTGTHRNDHSPLWR